MDGNGQFGMLDVLTIMSVMLQLQDHNRDVKQLSNDDLMKELQRQDREYLEQVIENQKNILSELSQIKEKLAKIG